MKFILFIVYMFFCSIGLVQFHLWPQVVVLWEMDARLIELILHPHGMRFLLVYPIFLAADFINVPYDLMFSLVAPVLIFITTHYVMQSVSVKLNLSQNNHKIMFFLVFMLLTLLSTFMNGRILFAITGASILLYALMGWDNIFFLKILKLFIIALFLSSVSSGTIFVSIITFVIFVLYKNFKSRKLCWKNISLLCFMFVFMFLMLPLLKVLIMKNVNYFGGGFDGVIEMLSHGFGIILLKMDFYVLVLSLLLLFFVLLVNLILLKYYNKVIVPLFFIAVSVFGGLFGFSTMMMMIPASLVIACIFVVKVNNLLVFGRAQPLSKLKG